ncbi:MAG: PepSY domain-containing protein [Nocardioidaceae bacterium]|nr:PepSY domain-containing protein [Nocardioidaceae bacterium]
MQRRTQIAVAGVAAVVGLGFGTGAVVTASTGDDEPDTAISGADAERAERAALDAVGGGTVTGTEVDDEQSAYEVEVTRGDGTQVDVQLDEAFRIVGQEDDGTGDDGEQGDDQSESGN